MSVRRRKKSSWFRVLTPAATLCLLGYFGFHAMNGSHGMRAQVVLQKRIEAQTVRLAEVSAEREALQADVALLADGALERDMVDEQVRRRLGMTRTDEIVLLGR